MAQEEPVQTGQEFKGSSELSVVNARGEARGEPTVLNFTLPNNARVLGAAQSLGVQQELTDFLKRHINPASGYVSLGGADISSITVHEVRQHVIVLDQPNAIEMTISEFLDLSGKCERVHDYAVTQNTKSVRA